MAIDITLTSVLYNPWSGSGGEALIVTSGVETLEVSYASLGFVASTSDSYKSTAGDIFKIYIDGTRIYRTSDSLYASGKNFLEVGDVDNSTLNGVSTSWSTGTTDTVWTIEPSSQKIVINKTAILLANLYKSTATNAVTFTGGTTIIEVRREVQDQSSPAVDFSNASILTEQDLDNSSANVFHMAQQAIETAGNALVYDTGTSSYAAYQPGTTTRRKITQVADGVAANDATNVGQFNTHDAAIEAQKVTTLAYREDTEDYKLESADWAQKADGQVKVYTDNSRTGGDLGHSAKAHASVVGTHAPSTGSAKEWAQTTGAAIDSTFSAKEYAQGTTAGTGGSALNWASQTGADITGGSSGDKSAKSWAQETGGTAPALGSAKEWAQDTGGVVADSEWSAKNWATGTHASNAPTSGSAKEWSIGGQGTMATTPDGSEFSAKEYAQGSTATGGTSKGWASTAYDTQVPGAGSSDRSSLHYSTDASNSAIAAKNSANAVANSFDSFDDTYLGIMADGATASSGSATGAWAKDSSTVTVTSVSGTIEVGQVVTGTGIPTSPKPNILSITGSSPVTSFVLSDNMVAADASEALTFVGYGIHGAYSPASGGKDGPLLDNDGDALAIGALYFNTSDNTMKIYDGANWIAATSAGTASLLEYKFVTTSGQVANRTYSGTADIGGPMSYTASNTLVFLNGVLLKETVPSGATHDYVAQNGTSIVLTAAAVLNDELTVVAYKSFTVSDTVSKASGGTFAGAVTFNAGLVANTVDINGGTIDGATITGNIVGNASGTAATVTGGTQSAITTATNLTSVGTLTAVTVTGAITANGGLETDTNSKIQQKGAFMQSSTHQSWVMGG